MSDSFWPRLAVMGAFFVNGAVLASWFPHIPGVSNALALPPSILGLVLLGPSIGCLFSMALSGIGCARFGNAGFHLLSLLLYCLALPFTVLARDPFSLTLVLVALGAGYGAQGIAMNAEALRLERQLGQRLMSTFHAFFSLGGLLGAALGGLLISWAIAPWLHLLLASLLFGLLGLWSTRPFSRTRAQASKQGFVWPTRFLVLLGIGAFGSILVEGAVADWAAIHLHALGMPEGKAAMGYAAFALAMVVARLLGDWMTDRLKAPGIVRLGGAVGTIGLLLVLTGRPDLGIAGFALIGLGLATVVPNFFSASGLEPSMPPASSVAMVSLIGFMGRLAGPPLIGLIAQGVSLRAAWGVLALFTVLVALSAGVLARPRVPESV